MADNHSLNDIRIKAARQPFPIEQEKSFESLGSYVSSAERIWHALSTFGAEHRITPLGLAAV
jgi:hypothetical protein